MGRAAEEWRRTVEPHFAFLNEYGFQITQTDDSSSWANSVTYTSPVAGIKITRSNEFGASEVELIRLVEGSVPPYPIWVTADRIDWALLDIVLGVRSPERHAELSRMKGLAKTELERQLAFWAESIQCVVSDFLWGDLSAIDEAAAVVREHVQDHPQQIVGYIPDDAPPDAEDIQAAKLAKMVPPEVYVAVRRYRSGKPPK